MTPEPKDVQLARAVIQAGVGANGLTEAIVSSAQTVVANYEANIEVGRKQAEERQRAIDETARRWPGLAAEGWRYVESEYNLSFHHSERTNVYIDRDEGILSSYSSREECQTDSAVVLALIDAAGRNTTAERLRKALVEIIEYSEDTGVPIAVCSAMAEIAKKALEAETWNR